MNKYSSPINAHSGVFRGRSRLSPSDRCIDSLTRAFGDTRSEHEHRTASSRFCSGVATRLLLLLLCSLLICRAIFPAAACACFWTTNMKYHASPGRYTLVMVSNVSLQSQWRGTATVREGEGINVYYIMPMRQEPGVCTWQHRYFFCHKPTAWDKSPMMLTAVCRTCRSLSRCLHFTSSAVKRS